MKGMTIMYDHSWKLKGVIISAAGLLAMIAERLHGFIIFSKWNVDQHYSIFQWIMLFGLILVIFSKERYDDERTKVIRLKSFQISFIVQQSSMLAIAITGSLAKKGQEFQGQDLFILSALGVVLYLLIFHVGLYFDFLWEYDDKPLMENLRSVSKNKWGIIVYLILSVVTLLSITLFGAR